MAQVKSAAAPIISTRGKLRPTTIFVFVVLFYLTIYLAILYLQMEITWYPII